MSDEERLEPLLMHPEPGPWFKAKEIAKALADGGVPFPTAAARVANYAKARQIHVREKGGNAAPNSPNLFAFADLCAAVMLSNLQDLGVADQNVLTLASVSLYGWTVGQETPRGVAHPIIAAAAATWVGNPWALQLDSFRHIDSELLQINRAFYRLGENPVWSQQRLFEPGWMPVGTILINTQGLGPLQRYIQVDKSAN